MPRLRTLSDLFDRMVAERGPQVALRSDDGSFVLTWSEYAAHANAAAAGLAGLGVGRGDTVACWLVDRPHAIADAAARVLITEPVFLGAALVVRGAGRTPLRIIVLVEGADACALTWAELLDCAPAGLDPDLAARAVQPDDAATLIHGADGNAVAITHRQILGLIARGDEGDPMIRNQSLLGPYGRWRVADPV
jgi:long-chain acyl-CoA synthetase